MITSTKPAKRQLSYNIFHNFDRPLGVGKGGYIEGATEKAKPRLNNPQFQLPRIISPSTLRIEETKQENRRRKS